jgi:hypothetical protein
MEETYTDIGATTPEAMAISTRSRKMIRELIATQASMTGSGRGA